MKRGLAMLVAAALGALGGWALARMQGAVPATDPAHVAFSRPAPTSVAAVTPRPRAVEPAVAAVQPIDAAPQFAPALAMHPDSAAVKAALRAAEDDRRLGALNAALEYDIALPPDLLVETYERPGSEELRLLAFETYIDSIASDVATARSAMHSATASNSPIVRSEAYRRLDQLEAYEAVLAESAARLPRASATEIGGMVP